uniref:Uncharacterized protein n=1 Tax=Arundo donax TaxID=35708 RepID=A0A0A9DWR7_ARUDO
MCGSAKWPDLTFFSSYYPCFCIDKTSYDEKVDRFIFHKQSLLSVF